MIPLSLATLLLTLFFTKIWIPSLVAMIFISVLLTVVGIFSFYFIKTSYQQFENEDNIGFEDNIKQRYWKLGFIGFVADFCDTIGIGSFAVSIVLLKLTKQVRNDKKNYGNYERCSYYSYLFRSDYFYCFNTSGMANFGFTNCSSKCWCLCRSDFS
ncbi:hypothetical protein [Spiroplasma endosymbiont of Virgichneumon dumeticola]|uniref:hypothetical protein n=1 Tax=Spiroplasma endosymbiont of Virgichneumon dumeticola TaxID=3139323 RepID=UPI0035C8F58B